MENKELEVLNQWLIFCCQQWTPILVNRVILHELANKVTCFDDIYNDSLVPVSFNMGLSANSSCSSVIHAFPIFQIISTNVLETCRLVLF